MRKLEGLFIVTSVLAIVACQESRKPRTDLPPETDGALLTSSGANAKGGKWLKGCPSPPLRCNLGVGNLGPANTYHWVEG